MIEWTIPLMVKAENGVVSWVWTKLVGGGNKHQVVADHRANHPEVVGADLGQAWMRWL
jgi:hypothetical protein